MSVFSIKSAKFLIAFLVLIIPFKANAQHSFDKFKGNYDKVFRYPYELTESCTPTYSALLIEVDSKGKIGRFEISDSAPVLMRQQFSKFKQLLKPELFNDYINEHHIKASAIIIPFFVIFDDDSCSNVIKDTDWVKRSYYKFNGAPYNKAVYNMPPLITLVTKPKH